MYIRYVGRDVVEIAGLSVLVIHIVMGFTFEPE